MKRDKSVLYDFKQSKILYMTTFFEGMRRNRQMTNFNDSPYDMMWFPTYRETRKVEDIKKNPRVLITFPSSEEGIFYEIEGRAEIDEIDTSSRKWKWWYLYWLPSMMLDDWLSRPKNKRQIKDVALINVYPDSIRTIRFLK